MIVPMCIDKDCFFLCFTILIESYCVVIITCLSLILRCYSYIGKVNLFPQPVNLRSSCFDEVSLVWGMLDIKLHDGFKI